MTLPAEQFHLDAIAFHERRLVELLGEHPHGISAEMLVTVYDLLAWAVRLREDVRGQLPPRVSAEVQPERDNRAHIAVGAKWARDQIVHGKGLRVVALRSIVIDDAFNSTDVAFNDPETGFNGGRNHATTRLEVVDRDVGDKVLRGFYNACVARRRAIVVARLLAGGPPSVPSD